MADPVFGDLAAAVSDALHGNRVGLNAIARDARQRTEQRAVDALTRRYRDASAPGQGLPPVARRVPEPGPDRDLEIRLPSGRRLRARISPAVARRKDLAALARASAENGRRTFHALRRQRGALVRLSQSQDELARKLSALEQQSDRTLLGLIEGLTGSNRQVSNAGVQAQAGRIATGTAGGSTPSRASEGRAIGRRPLPSELQREHVRQLRDTKLLAVRAQIQSATSVVNSIQAAAYGQRGSVLSTNNLLLAGTQLFWGALAPALESVGAVNAASATVLAAIAPVGTLLTGEVLLGDRQHVRIISGVTTVDASGSASESLRGRVAEGFWPEFRQRADVLVTARVVHPPNLVALSVLARVNQGNLELRVLRPPAPSLPTGLSFISGPFAFASPVIPRPAPPVRVAWTVDLGADVA